MSILKLKTLCINSVSPANFGLVMATGIISIASHLLGFQWLSRFLFNINIFFFIALWILMFLSMSTRPRHFFSALSDYSGGPGFFSAIAGTSILGSQFVILDNNHQLANYLWVFACILWTALMYAFFTAITIKKEKPTLEKGLNGSWLLTIVATQSITVLGSFLIQDDAPFNASFMEFFILAMWLAGGVLYVLVITMIFYRYLFKDFAPADLSPTYWINMGGMAISTLAGARLIIISPDSILLSSMMPFLKGLTLLFWAAGTWWIPLLIFLEIWRHIYKHYPISYNPIYWGLIFPLGMYSVSTYEIIKIFNLTFILTLPHVFLYAAVLCWIAACYGLVRKVWRYFGSLT